MRVLLPICVSALLCVGCRATSASKQSQAMDEQAIQKVADDFGAAWNRHDMRAFAELFTDDADFVVITGRHLKGREEIFRYHDELHKGIFKDRRGDGQLKDVRFIRPDVAIGHVAFQGSSTSGDERRKTTAFATVVLTKQQGGWLITALHNTLVSGPPGGVLPADPK